MILFLLAAFGLAYICGHSTISLPLRKWMGGTPFRVRVKGEIIEGVSPEDAKLLDGAQLVPAKPGAFGPFGDFLTSLIECPACFGFWIGLVAGLTGFVPMPHEGISAFAWPMTLGCITAGSNFGLSRLTRLI